MNEQPDTVIMFLAGLGTSLSRPNADAQPGGTMHEFWDEDKLVPYIKRSGFPARYLVYSYRGVDNKASRDSLPKPYTASDTLNQRVVTYVERLVHQLRAYAERHSSVEFHLVGHSGGGLIAFTYLALLANTDRWRLPSGAKLASVSTLDAPLGGIASPGRAHMMFIRAYLAITHRWRYFTSFNDLLKIYRSSNHQYPLGGRASVMELFGREARHPPFSNQDVACSAVQHGVRVLTIGNVRDYYFAPGFGLEPFISTQWIADNGSGSGVHGRWVVLGKRLHSLSDVEVNHGAVLSDPSVHQGILAFIDGGDPTPLLPAPRPESMKLWLAREDPIHVGHPTPTRGMNA